MREAKNEGSGLYRRDNNTKPLGVGGNNPSMVVPVQGTRLMIEMRTRKAEDKTLVPTW